METSWFACVNCQVELDLSWSRYFVMSKISRTSRTVCNLPAQQMTKTTTSAAFQINNSKLYVPVVTWSIYDNIKVLENIKQEFKRTVSCNKYRSEIETQLTNNNLHYLIDLTFTNTNRLFVLSFKTGNDDPTRDS